MLNKILSPGALLIAVSAVFLSAGPALAQHGGGHGGGGHGGGHGGGGFHGGGFHGGGFHGGGFHGGGFHGGVRGPTFHGSGFHGPGIHRSVPFRGPGFHGPGFRGPGFRGPGFHGRGFFRGGFWYPYGYGSAYPYYGDSYYYYPYYGGTTYSLSPDTGDSGYDEAVTPPYTADSDPSGNAPVTGPQPAELTVKVPDGADVWIGGKQMTLTGPVRHFTSPPLEPGRRYSYEIRATWKVDGQDVTQTQTVSVSPGGSTEADFPTQPTAAGR